MCGPSRYRPRQGIRHFRSRLEEGVHAYVERLGMDAFFDRCDRPVGREASVDQMRIS